MSTEAIPAATFIREYTRELHNKNAAVFAGAGLSTGSGYVDWKGLLSEIVRDLGRSHTGSVEMLFVNSEGYPSGLCALLAAPAA